MRRSSEDENQIADKEALMVRYLLGELSEAEQMEFASQYLTDDKVYEQLCAVEADLVDDYVRGELPANEREEFERHYLASPRRRQKTEVARVLLALDSTTPEAQATEDHPQVYWWQSWLSFLRGLRLTMVLGTAAVALFLVAGIWLAIKTFRLQAQVERLRADQVARVQREAELQREATEQHERSEQLSEELQRERKERQSSTPATAAPTTSAPVMTSFVLIPRLTRDQGEAKRLIILPGVSLVQFQLSLSKRDEYGSYRAVLHTASGDEVWSQIGIKAHRQGSGKTVLLQIPARLLARRDYVLTLSGVTASGEVEDLNDYSFRVVEG